jgi:DnaJ-class molecular chaperone
LTHYDTLHVSSTATDAEVRKAFQQIAKVFHPDSTPTVEDALAVGDVDWDEAQAAYEAIKTPERRAKYDAQLFILRPKCSRCKGTKKIQEREGWAVKDRKCPDCKGTGKQPLPTKEQPDETSTQQP